MCRVPWIDEDVTLEGEEDWMYNGEKANESGLWGYQ